MGRPVLVPPAALPRTPRPRLWRRQGERQRERAHCWGHAKCAVQVNGATRERKTALRGERRDRRRERERRVRERSGPVCTLSLTRETLALWMCLLFRIECKLVFPEGTAVCV